MKTHIDERIWAEYFKFSFERDPFDKAISRYYWSTREPRPSIETYLNAAPVKQLSNWDIYSINDHVAVDFVGRYETLQQDLATIAARLGLPTVPELPRAKAEHRLDRKHYSALLTPAARARVERVCAKEMRTFGYEWDAVAVAAKSQRTKMTPDGATGGSGRGEASTRGRRGSCPREAQRPSREHRHAAASASFR